MSRCVSDLALERYLLDEPLGDAEREHIIGCVQCRARLAAKQRAGNAYMRSRDAEHLAQLLATADHIFVPRRTTRRRFALAAAAAVAVVAVAALVTFVLWPRDTMDAKAEVLATEKAWMNAYLNNDVAALDEILADNYQSIDPAGRVRTKADDLARTKTRRYESYDTSDVQVRIWGNTAVVTGRSRVRGSDQGRTFEAEITFTDTLARIDGRWRAVSAHVTQVR